jgi:peptidoglycan/LPS O-acetylase OafA/YrhL
MPVSSEDHVTGASVPRRADLDGLRGLAIALVLLEHGGITSHDGQVLPFTPAMSGVTVFFVLSGDPITGILMRGPLEIGAFYRRRAIRLTPPLLALVAAVCLVGLSGWSDTPVIPGVLATASYSSNWAQIAGVDLGLLGHTWSLAIEEQFYLVWPLALAWLPRRLLLPVAILGATVGCAMYALEIGPVYHSSLTNGGAILAGCALALHPARVPRALGAAGVALIACSAVFWWQAVAVIGALLAIAGRPDALLPLAALGRRGYSLYLWSWPCVLLVGGLEALAATVILAELSYRLIEVRLQARAAAPTSASSIWSRRSGMSGRAGVRPALRAR